MAQSDCRDHHQTGLSELELQVAEMHTDMQYALPCILSTFEKYSEI